VSDTTTAPAAAPAGPPAPSGRSGLAGRGGTVVVTVLSLFLALVVGGVLIAIADEKTRTALGYFTDVPADTFRFGWDAISSAYVALFEGAVVDPSALSSGSWQTILAPLSNTLLNATPLICAGLAVGLAFRSGLFNIGAQGQIIIATICAAYVGFGLSLPT
jgi:simple sugar transport system permease protein